MPPLPSLPILKTVLETSESLSSKDTDFSVKDEVYDVKPPSKDNLHTPRKPSNMEDDELSSTEVSEWEKVLLFL